MADPGCRPVSRGAPSQRSSFLAIVDRILPTLRRLERIVRPRAGWLAGPWARIPVGIICLVLAIIIALPVPLGHVVPGTAISVLALGLIERDGIAIALGIITAIFGLLIVVFASAGILSAARLWQG
ncbi:MAG TPA: exopolysaccharide biosynthesis protein [Stellaceae bacterium]